MSIVAYPTEAVLSRSLISVGTLMASVVIGISSGGVDYLPLAVPAFTGLCAVVGLFAGVVAVLASRRSPAPHSVTGPVLRAAGSGVIIGWTCRLFLVVLAR
jgi:hypothetical protein